MHGGSAEFFGYPAPAAVYTVYACVIKISHITEKIEFHRHRIFKMLLHMQMSDKQKPVI